MKYLTLKQLSDVSGLPAITIRRYVKSGRIVAFQPGGVGAKLLFPPDALEVLHVRDASEGDEAEPSINVTSVDLAVVKIEDADRPDIVQLKSKATHPAKRRPRAKWRRNLPNQLTSKEA
jgi:hypothetical protein